ncbi:hypothetical protein J1N35_004002 [Gossypium stocksii]|uniref:Protein kinase domain-containing protein n=1 Tax=Gossypium stocksii TaxID=47602 RepID=A0A9D4AFM6_9ROSI|nr:hypothetical protein J1N35_004002 [Gossypium stocksii]
MTIAVKVLHVNQDRAFKSFDIECEVLRNIRHRNLVKIISSCSNVEFKALVLEFMPNGSLEKWLYSQNHFLNVLQRLNIVIDIALAVEYLHLDHSLSVVHCDIKPNNILLDTDIYGCAFGCFWHCKTLRRRRFNDTNKDTSNYWIHVTR